MHKKLIYGIVILSWWSHIEANPLTWVRDRYNQWWADRSFKTLTQLQQQGEKHFAPALLKSVAQLRAMESTLRSDQQVQLQHWQELADKEYYKKAEKYLNRIASQYAAMQDKIREIDPTNFYRVPDLDMDVPGAAYIDLLREIIAPVMSNYLSRLDTIKKYLSADQRAEIDRWQAIVSTMRKK